MQSDRTKGATELPAISKMDADSTTLQELKDFVGKFTRPMRGRPTHRILDCFCHEYYLIFDFSHDPETPDAQYTCDILLVPLPDEDVLAEAMRLVANANRHGVLRLLAALGIERFPQAVKTAFYESTNPLRTKG